MKRLQEKIANYENFQNAFIWEAFQIKLSTQDVFNDSILSIIDSPLEEDSEWASGKTEGKNKGEMEEEK